MNNKKIAYDEKGIWIRYANPEEQKEILACYPKLKDFLKNELGIDPRYLEDMMFQFLSYVSEDEDKVIDWANKNYKHVHQSGLTYVQEKAEKMLKDNNMEMPKSLSYFVNYDSIVRHYMGANKLFCIKLFYGTGCYIFDSGVLVED